MVQKNNYSEMKKAVDLSRFYFYENSRTPSFFALGRFIGISNQMVEGLINVSGVYKETSRYCLHNDPQDSLHVMLIYHPYKKLIPEQIFKNTDSYYLVLEGKISLTNLETKEKIILDKKNFLGKVGSNIPYQMEIISENVLFIEIRERNTKEKS